MVSLLKYQRTDDRRDIQSVMVDDLNRNFLELELQYVL